jgi:hypothetical protein
MVDLTIGLQYDRRTTNKVLEECTKLLIMCCEHGEVQPNFFWAKESKSVKQSPIRNISYSIKIS